MPVTLDLYGHPWSAPTREVRILCAELGVEHRFIEVKQAEAGDYLPEALNPACKVPMIDAGGFILGEAHAIVRYLAARHDPAGVWYPTAIESRSKVDQWLDWQALRLGRLAAELVRQRRFRPDAPDAAACAEAERLLGLILPELDMELKATPFVCGQHPTLADIAIFTSVDYLRLAGFDSGRFTSLGRWFDVCAARPAWAASAHPQESAQGSAE
ncbi:glutathione S-transferase family protein [Immundisolibacter sp.]